jgi:hypothetical protein
MRLKKRNVLGILLVFALMLGLMPALGMDMTAYAYDTSTVTWEQSVLKSREYHRDYAEEGDTYTEYYTVSKDNITLKTDSISETGFGGNNGQFTLTTPGKSFNRIEIAGPGGFDDEGTGWKYDRATQHFIWTGIAESVKFTGQVELKSIVFTIGPSLVNYPVWVGDTQITNYNCEDVFGDSTVRYYPGSATLILEDYSYEGPGHWNSPGIYGGIYADQSLTIGLKGNNNIKCTEMRGIGIYVNGDVYFAGGNVLNVTGGNNGIRSTGNIKIRGVTINARATLWQGISSDIAAVFAKKTIELRSCTLNAIADGTPYMHGLYIDHRKGYVDIDSGAFLTAIGGRQAIYGKVKNADVGAGWENTEGTLNETTIDMEQKGQYLDLYKKVMFPAYAGEPTDDDTPTPTPTPSDKGGTTPAAAAPSTPQSVSEITDLNGVKIKSVSGAKKSFTVKWKKLSKSARSQVAKIEVQYSKTPDFAKATTTTAKNSASSCKVKKLKANKTYYVRIRTSKVVNGTTHVSAWSKVKKVKTK